jgi:hypothetical protein
MSDYNRFQGHLIILPEDDANRQLANGFIKNINIKPRTVQILPPAKGWEKAVDDVMKNHVPEMRSYADRRVVLLIDFDNDAERVGEIKNKIPDDVKARLFVLGTLSEPEKLKSDTRKSFEQIGGELAQECFENTNELWHHQLLKHNEPELERMVQDVKSFLFSA